MYTKSEELESILLVFKWILLFLNSILVKQGFGAKLKTEAQRTEEVPKILFLV